MMFQLMITHPAHCESTIPPAASHAVNLDHDGMSGLDSGT